MLNAAGYLGYQKGTDSCEFPGSVSRRNTANPKPGMRKIFAAKFSTSIKWTICFFFLR